MFSILTPRGCHPGNLIYKSNCLPSFRVLPTLTNPLLCSVHLQFWDNLSLSLLCSSHPPDQKTLTPTSSFLTFVTSERLQASAQVCQRALPPQPVLSQHLRQPGQDTRDARKGGTDQPGRAPPGKAPPVPAPATARTSCSARLNCSSAFRCWNLYSHCDHLDFEYLPIFCQRSFEWTIFI